MKKLLVALLTGLSLVTLAGCGQPTEVQEGQQPQVKVEEQKEEKKEYNIDIAQFPLSIVPSTDMEDWVKGTYENQSEYAVKFMQYEFATTVDGVKESSFLIFGNTTLPGETSIASDIPMLSEDAELIEVSIDLVDKENKKEIHVIYDAKLETSEIYIEDLQ